MKTIYCIILLSFVTLSSYAQQLEIVSPLTHEASVGAANVPTDNNGNPCAKIIIEAPIDGIEIEGSYIVGEAVKSTGKYELFVAIPKKQGRKLTLLHDSYGSLDIDLWTKDGALVGREAYR
ncbi:MAG: hypothetical protein HUJ98_13730, partial [Bacteroidaceae bacterium]|nr:hypothetical protein [Bacteroidaceae bacterium]